MERDALGRIIFIYRQKEKSKRRILYGDFKTPLGFVHLYIPRNITRVNNPKVMSCLAHVRRTEEMINMYKTLTIKYVGGGGSWEMH